MFTKDKDSGNVTATPIAHLQIINNYEKTARAGESKRWERGDLPRAGDILAEE